ncbi:MAG: hypothetical protein Aurels2KO_26160 [Aureliella sp.]
MAKNAIYLLLLLALSVVLFVGGQFVGDWFRGSVALPEQVGGGRGVVKQRPKAATVALDHLPPELALQGMRAIRQDDGTTLFAHPQSPCWLEVPTTQEKTVAAVTGDDRGFVGPDACQPCHTERHEDFIHTAHYLASSLPSPDVMEGEFAGPQRRMRTNHPDLHFEMSERGGEYFQTVSFRELEKEFRIDLVTGAGLVGQTHLFWQGDELFQHHVTYFTKSDRWVNSPGYVDGTAWYSRRVIPKCVQCHATYLDWVEGTENSYDPSSLIAGVTCERCHGPGREHVEFHRANPGVEAPYAIVDPKELTTEQLNDLCAQCHFGSGALIAEPFSFQPGDRIADHWDIAPEKAGSKGGVHSSNQLQRMQKSRCFIESKSLACIDCHNPHKNERGNLKLYSSRCIECHVPNECGKHDELGDSIASNCIDCHMPREPDDHLSMQTSSDTDFPLLRDHYIRVQKE